MEDKPLRHGPGLLELPDEPAGWTPAAWNALRASVAARQAHRIYRTAVKLLDDLQDFPNDHGPDCDLEAVLAAGQPLPTANPWHLRYVRCDFTGFAWAVERFLDAVRDDIPEPLEAEPKPEADAAPPAPEAATGFEAHHARHLRDHPGYARRLDDMTEAEREREMARLRRQHAYRTSDFYADAHAIHQLADDLHDRMRAFVARYDGSEAATALASAGLTPPSADAYETEPAEVFQDVFDLINGTEFNIGLFLSCMDTVSAPPPDRESDTREKRAAA